MKRSRCIIAALAAACSFAVSGLATAVPVIWADWTSADATSAAGTIGGIGVSFSGNINPPAQTAGGVNFWAVNPGIYTAPGLDNGPPDSDIIRLTGGTGTGLQTIMFSAPVENPVMAIMSLGQPSVQVQYDFVDAPFDIRNSGPGFFGGGVLNELAGDILQGFEGHGLIQFIGAFTSISFNMPFPEFWHGFQIGVPGAAPVPEPGTLALLGLGLAGLGLVRRRRRG